jgi:hypothetical protein
MCLKTINLPKESLSEINKKGFSYLFCGTCALHFAKGD